MIEITPDIVKKFPAVFKVARRDKMRVVWLEDDLVYVARRGKGHDRYLVSFNALPDGSRVWINCKSLYDLRECKGMRFHQLCAHAARVLQLGIPKGRQNKLRAA